MECTLRFNTCTCVTDFLLFITRQTTKNDRLSYKQSQSPERSCRHVGNSAMAVFPEYSSSLMSPICEV